MAISLAGIDVARPVHRHLAPVDLAEDAGRHQHHAKAGADQGERDVVVGCLVGDVRLDAQLLGEGAQAGAAGHTGRPRDPALPGQPRQLDVRRVAEPVPGRQRQP